MEAGPKQMQGFMGSQKMRGSLKYEVGVGGRGSITTTLQSAMEVGPRQIQGFKGSQKMRGSLEYEFG